MFWKLIHYDLRAGFTSTYKRYLVAAGAFVVMFFVFWMQAANVMRSRPGTQIDYSLGNALFFAFAGMKKYTPGGSGVFQFPAFWMLSYLLLAYITLYYPYNDLEEFGQQVLIRSGGRGLWWLSKCVWNLVSVIAFFALAWGIFSVGCLVTGGSLSMNLSPDIRYLVPMEEESALFFPSAMPLHTMLLPLMVMAALNLVQMTLSLFIKPFFSYIVTVTVLLVSAYYVSPFCIGNYAMPLRSTRMIRDGVNPIAGMVISIVLFAVAALVGCLTFKRRNILKSDT